MKMSSVACWDLGLSVGLTIAVIMGIVYDVPPLPFVLIVLGLAFGSFLGTIYFGRRRGGRDEQ